jgi:hypothetical protein
MSFWNSTASHSGYLTSSTNNGQRRQTTNTFHQLTETSKWGSLKNNIASTNNGREKQAKKKICQYSTSELEHGIMVIN